MCKSAADTCRGAQKSGRGRRGGGPFLSGVGVGDEKRRAVGPLHFYFSFLLGKGKLYVTKLPKMGPLSRTIFLETAVHMYTQLSNIFF